MKRYVNGEEVELDPGAAKVSRLPDRLMVHGEQGSNSAVAMRNGGAIVVSYKGHVYTILNAKPRSKAGSGAASGELRAPMPGLIVDVLVSEGAIVTKGQKILVLEAMKTQQPFLAPFDGTVKSLAIEKGRQVGEGELLALIVRSEPSA